MSFSRTTVSMVVIITVAILLTAYASRAHRKYASKSQSRLSIETVMLLEGSYLIPAISEASNATTNPPSMDTNSTSEYPNGHPRGEKPFKKRWIHLDLKGAPPRLSYLARLFPLLQQLGVGGLLIEWEDSFRYEDRLAILSAPNAYTKEDVKEILRLANVSSLEVVPLIQSFGHMEFVLKHSVFAHLRETDEKAICPSRNETIPLIRDMIKQMRKFHPQATRIHIGADEAYSVAKDVHCRKRLRDELNGDIEKLKLGHIAEVARVALEEGFTEVLAWYDMFERSPIKSMEEAQLGKLITPIIWGYAEDVTANRYDGEPYFANGTFDRISHVFDKIWFGSAFKGANGAKNVFIEPDRYLKTHQSYVKLYRDFEEILHSKVEGIILTGWSRFDHRMQLCELLPTSLPSIVLNLLYLDDVTASSEHIYRKTKEFLSCPSTLPDDLYKARRYNQSIYTPPKEQLYTLCSFPSSDLFTVVQELHFLTWQADKVSASDRSNFNTRLLEIESRLRPLLSALLFDDAVREFIRDKVHALRRV